MRERRPAVAAGLLWLLCLAGCRPAAPPPDDLLERLPSPAAPGSAQPWLSAGADGRLYLSWVESAAEAHGVLRFSVRDAAGWSEPRTIASGDDWFVNWADVPSIAALDDGTLAAHWLVKSGEATYAYHVMAAVSLDNGLTWTEPVRVHDDTSDTEHGFASLLGVEGRFLVVWLDGRATAEGGAMTLRRAWLDRHGEMHDEALVDGRVCDCCPTSTTAVDRDGALVAYRDRSDAEIRDIHVAGMQNDVWSEPQPLHNDNWSISGCPVNGPALDARGESVAAAWFTGAVLPEGGVRVAFSRDGGRSFETPLRVDDGKPLGRVSLVLLDDGSAVVGWLEAGGESATIRVRRVYPTGESGESRVLTETIRGRAGGIPRLAGHGGELFMAWTEVGEPPRVLTGRFQPSALATAAR